MTTLYRHLLEKQGNPKIPKSTTSLDKHHLLGDQDKPQGTFPTRAVSGIPQDLVWELSLFAVGGRSVSLFNRSTARSDRSVAEFNLGRRGCRRVVFHPSFCERRKKKDPSLIFVAARRAVGELLSGNPILCPWRVVVLPGKYKYKYKIFVHGVLPGKYKKNISTNTNNLPMASGPQKIQI